MTLRKSTPSTSLVSIALAVAIILFMVLILVAFSTSPTESHSAKAPGLFAYSSTPRVLPDDSIGHLISIEQLKNRLIEELEKLLLRRWANNQITLNENNSNPARSKPMLPDPDSRRRLANFLVGLRTS